MLVLKHNPEKWLPVFEKRSCSNKEVERDDDSTRSHRALDRVMAVPKRKSPEPAQAVAAALRTLATERDGLEVLMRAVEDGLGEGFVAAVELIAAAKGRIIVTGMGKSGHIARKVASTLASTGTPAHYVHPGEASHGDLGMVQPEDVILALSWSGETTELADLIAYAKRFRVGLVGITANAASTLARQTDIALVLPKAQEACP